MKIICLLRYISNHKKQKKLAMLKYTYEQIKISRAEQLQVGEGNTTLDINKTEKNILQLIENNKKITQLEIAKILNLSENCIYRNLKSLREKNIIIRIGSNKNGYWEIRDKFRDNFSDNFIDFDKVLII